MDASELTARGTAADMELRAAVRSAMRNVDEFRRCPLEFELRDAPNGTGGTDLVFTGYASVTGDTAAYDMEDFLGPWTESVSVGAFKKTLSESCDTSFLLNHGGMTLARTKSGTLKLAERTDGNPTGLHCEARLDLANPTVVAVRSAVERGDLDEMSFAFRVVRQEWDEDYARRWINEVSLAQGDVSLVNYGANPHTAGLVAVRSKGGQPDWRSLMDVYAAAHRELREGKVLSAATLDTLKQGVEHLGSADTVAARQLFQDLIDIHDPASSGASGNTETNSASTALLAEALLVTARNRDAEKKRRAA